MVRVLCRREVRVGTAAVLVRAAFREEPPNNLDMNSISHHGLQHAHTSYSWNLLPPPLTSSSSSQCMLTFRESIGLPLRLRQALAYDDYGSLLLLLLPRRPPRRKNLEQLPRARSESLIRGSIACMYIPNSRDCRCKTWEAGKRDRLRRVATVFMIENGLPTLPWTPYSTLSLSYSTCPTVMKRPPDRVEYTALVDLHRPSFAALFRKLRGLTCE